MEKITQKVAEFICSSRYENIPRDAAEIGKLHILDTLGVLIAGSREDVATIVKGYIKSLGCRQESTVLTQGIKTSSAYAAFGNGMIAHVLDFDDYESPSMAHPSVTVLPAVFALGEKLKVPGRLCLAAYLLGMEIISKVGRAINPDHYDKGWHSTGTLGALGAATASAKLLKLDAERVSMALGIAASTSSGLRANFGTMTKSFHAGHAARNGVESALLASQGCTASRDVFESDLGFCDVFTEGKNYDVRKIVESLGAPFSIQSPGVGKKPYPSCAATHSFIDGIFELIERHDLKAEDVDAVECGIFYRLPSMLIHSQPRTGLEGKFSLEFCVALALQDRKVSIRQFTDEQVREPKIQELIKKIKKEVTEEAGGKDTLYPAAILRVRMKNGKNYSCRIEKRKGSPASPLSVKETMDKFMECAQLHYSADQSRRIAAMVMDMEQTEDIGQVIQLF
jgi:2-methylcitrate dehydratase PrpD